MADFLSSATFVMRDKFLAKKKSSGSLKDPSSATNASSDNNNRQQLLDVEGIALTVPYSVKVYSPSSSSSSPTTGTTTTTTTLSDEIEKAVASCFSRIESIFSPFCPTSEISLCNCNHNAPTTGASTTTTTAAITPPSITTETTCTSTKWIPCSYEFFSVLQVVDILWEKTSGLFDPTVVKFGRWYHNWLTPNNQSPPPPKGEVDKWEPVLGWRKCIQLAEFHPGDENYPKPNEILQTSTSSTSFFFIKKSHPLVTIDLCGISKGWAVDLVADQLQEGFGFLDILVDWGGDVTARGGNPVSRGPWVCGVMEPTERVALAVLRQRGYDVSDGGDEKKEGVEKEGERSSEEKFSVFEVSLESSSSQHSSSNSSNSSGKFALCTSGDYLSKCPVLQYHALVHPEMFTGSGGGDATKQSVNQNISSSSSSFLLQRKVTSATVITKVVEGASSTSSGSTSISSCMLADALATACLLWRTVEGVQSGLRSAGFLLPSSGIISASNDDDGDEKQQKKVDENVVSSSTTTASGRTIFNRAQQQLEHQVLSCIERIVLVTTTDGGGGDDADDKDDVGVDDVKTKKDGTAGGDNRLGGWYVKSATADGSDNLDRRRKKKKGENNSSTSTVADPDENIDDGNDGDSDEGWWVVIDTASPAADEALLLRRSSSSSSLLLDNRKPKSQEGEDRNHENEKHTSATTTEKRSVMRSIFYQMPKLVCVVMIPTSSSSSSLSEWFGVTMTSVIPFGFDMKALPSSSSSTSTTTAGTSCSYKSHAFFVMRNSFFGHMLLTISSSSSTKDSSSSSSSALSPVRITYLAGHQQDLAARFAAGQFLPSLSEADDVFGISFGEGLGAALDGVIVSVTVVGDHFLVVMGPPPSASLEELSSFSKKCFAGTKTLLARGERNFIPSSPSSAKPPSPTEQAAIMKPNIKLYLPARVAVVATATIYPTWSTSSSSRKSPALLATILYNCDLSSRDPSPGIITAVTGGSGASRLNRTLFAAFEKQQQQLHQQQQRTTTSSTSTTNASSSSITEEEEPAKEKQEPPNAGLGHMHIRLHFVPNNLDGSGLVDWFSDGNCIDGATQFMYFDVGSNSKLLWVEREGEDERVVHHQESSSVGKTSWQQKEHQKGTTKREKDETKIKIPAIAFRFPFKPPVLDVILSLGGVQTHSLMAPTSDGSESSSSSSSSSPSVYLLQMSPVALPGESYELGPKAQSRYPFLLA